MRVKDSYCRSGAAWLGVVVVSMAIGVASSFAHDRAGSVWPAQNHEGSRPDQRPGPEGTGPMSGTGSIRASVFSFHA